MEKGYISVLKKYFSVTLILITTGTLPFSITTNASSSYIDSFSTSNSRLIISTNWLYLYGPSNDPVVASQILVYIANGTTSNGMLSIFVVINGQVSSRGPWYEDDSGLSDPNGPTMESIFNISNNPSNTYILSWDPSGEINYNQVGTIQYTLSTAVSLNENNVQASGNAGITAQLYVYQLSAASIQPSGSNPNYVKGWYWALNQRGANNNAQNDYYWPSSVMFFTQPVSSNNLWPSQTINITASTYGNFWQNGLFSSSYWHGETVWKIDIETIHG